MTTLPLIFQVFYDKNRKSKGAFTYIEIQSVTNIQPIIVWDCVNGDKMLNNNGPNIDARLNFDTCEHILNHTIGKDINLVFFGKFITELVKTCKNLSKM